MSRIAIINPTTTRAFGERNGVAGEAVACADTEILSVTMTDGPPSIEGHYDEAISTIALLEEIRKLERQEIDGYVLACFGDPGIWAAREIAQGPIIGIAEASFHAASIVATKFSVVTTLARTKVICEHLLQVMGMASRCGRVRATGIEVLALEHGDRPTFERIVAECRQALDEDDSGAIVLGCAGMADLAKRLQDGLGVPVIEGVAAGVKLIESLVSLGLSTSKRGDLAYPIDKAYTGTLERFSPSSSVPPPFPHKEAIR
ncbi:MAG: aspartate/glutamate racemase family protein [Pseudomonadota bacterium]